MMFGETGMQRVGAYQRYRTVSNSTFGGSLYVPAKVPTDVTKENMRTAIQAYFAEYLRGDQKALQNLISVIKEIKSNKWKEFFHEEKKEKFLGYKVKYSIIIKESANLLNEQEKEVLVTISVRAPYETRTIEISNKDYSIPKKKETAILRKLSKLCEAFSKENAERVNAN